MPRFRACILAGSAMVVTVAGVTGIAADAVGASAPRAVSLGYTCAFPSGDYRVGFQIAATVAPGARIGPVGLRVTTRLPRAALATYSGPVRVVDLLTVIESRPSAAPVTARWPISATGQLPAGGDLRLTASGTIPAAAAPAAGVVTFSADRLGVVVYLGQGRAIRANCMPVGGAARLASQRVIEAARPAKSRNPAGCARIKQVGNGVPTCAYLTGFSDVAKLIGAAFLQFRAPAKPALVNVDFAERFKIGSGTVTEHSTGELFYRGRHELPSVSATFLAFGFVPVRATIHLTELGTITIVSVSGVAAPPFPITVIARSKVLLRVSNVRVNGVRLDVGRGCRPAAPLRLVLVARGVNTSPPRGYTVPTGGALSGKVTIPPFIDCGVTQNLDPLLTGTISGRGNFVKLTQGKLCGPSQPQNFVCPPPVPKPER